MQLASWNIILTQSFQEVWWQISNIAPRIIVAIVLLIIGWLVGAVLGGIVAQIIRSLRVDKALESLGADELVTRAGFRLDSGAFVGGLVRWFFIITFLLASVNILGLTEVGVFLRDIVLGYLPRVFVASIILLSAAVVADTAQHIVLASSRAAGFRSAGFLGSIAKWSIWIFALLIALPQLGIAQEFSQVLFSGVVAMLAIAGGLAFGLGGKDAAADFIDKLRHDMAGKK